MAAVTVCSDFEAQENSLSVVVDVTPYVWNRQTELKKNFSGYATQHIEISPPGIKPMPPAMEAQSLNH